MASSQRGSAHDALGAMLSTFWTLPGLQKPLKPTRMRLLADGIPKESDATPPASSREAQRPERWKRKTYAEKGKGPICDLWRQPSAPPPWGPAEEAADEGEHRKRSR
jgi:hypothetical protein